MDSLQESNVKQNDQVRFKDLLLIGVGGWGLSTYSFLGISFLMIFFTDAIGVNIATVSLMVLITRIFDALNDPIIGSIPDRYNTRFGKYKPWILFGGIAWAALLILMFAAQPDWSEGGKVAWMYITYIASTLAGTCCLMSFTALNNVVSTDGQTRQILSSIRNTFAVGVIVVLSFCVPILLRTFAQYGLHKGYFYTAVLFCCIGLIPLCITGIKAKENPNVISQAGAIKIPLKTQMRGLYKNRALMALIFGMLVYGMNTYGRSALITYYFTYYAGDFALFGTYSLASFGASVVGGLLCVPALRFFKEKGRTVWVCLMSAGILITLCMFVPAPRVGYWIMSVVAGLGMGIASTTQHSMLGDAADYGEYITGVRCDGFAAAVFSFMNKLGAAIGPAIGGIVLAATGFQANVAQTPAVLESMNMVSHLMPGLLTIAAALIFLLFYNLTSAKHEDIRKELAARRRAGENLAAG